ncbi:hypothetical protein [Micromonospora sp. RTGN7]|uniref:hypothetical protein n=1 Tax=Micromonospora sp. RTGN7 TaxID=3016526 RepID=UPI0029FEF870|nr:hypothetical protein [Micromonospora sp. RTGN7]
MTKDELLAELLVERYGPRPLPPAAPPHPVPLAPAVPVAPPARHRHLVVLDGGRSTTTAA